MSLQKGRANQAPGQTSRTNSNSFQIDDQFAQALRNGQNGGQQNGGPGQQGPGQQVGFSTHGPLSKSPSLNSSNFAAGQGQIFNTGKIDPYALSPVPSLGQGNSPVAMTPNQQYQQAQYSQNLNQTRKSLFQLTQQQQQNNQNGVGGGPGPGNNQNNINSNLNSMASNNNQNLNSPLGGSFMSQITAGQNQIPGSPVPSNNGQNGSPGSQQQQGSQLQGQQNPNMTQMNNSNMANIIPVNVNQSMKGKDEFKAQINKTTEYVKSLKDKNLQTILQSIADGKDKDKKDKEAQKGPPGKIHSFSRILDVDDPRSVFMEAFRIRATTPMNLEKILLRRVVLKDYEAELDSSLKLKKQREKRELAFQNITGVNSKELKKDGSKKSSDNKDESFGYKTESAIDKLLCPLWILRFASKINRIRREQGGATFQFYKTILYFSAAISITTSPFIFAFQDICIMNDEDSDYTAQEQEDFYRLFEWFSAINSLIYSLLAIPGRLMFTYVSLDNKIEYTRSLDVTYHLIRTSSFWLDLIPMFVIYLEFQEPTGFRSDTATQKINEGSESGIINEDAASASAASLPSDSYNFATDNAFGALGRTNSYPEPKEWLRLLLLLRLKRIIDERDEGSLVGSLMYLICGLGYVTHLFACILVSVAFQQAMVEGINSWIFPFLSKAVIKAGASALTTPFSDGSSSTAAPQSQSSSMGQFNVSDAMGQYTTNGQNGSNGSSKQQLLQDPSFDWSTPSSCFAVYATAYYFSGTTFFTVGYGDIQPLNSMERLSTVFVMLFGQVILAKVIADLNWITSTANSFQLDHFHRMAQIRTALTSMNMPQEIITRVLRYTEFVNTLHKQKLLSSYLDELSPPLKAELALATYSRLLIDAQFFRGQPSQVVSIIVQSFIDRVFLPADFIVRRGDTGQELFFLRTGIAIVTQQPGAYSDQKEIAKLVEGQYFGEVALLTGRPRTAWIMSKTYCILSILFKEVFERLHNTFTSCYVDLLKSMKTVSKVEPTVSLEQIAEKILNHFGDFESAYCTFCFKGGGGSIESYLSCEEWEQALSLFNISVRDSRLLWTELDITEQTEETIDKDADPMNQSNSINNNSVQMHGVAAGAGKSKGFIDFIQFYEGMVNALGLETDEEDMLELEDGENYNDDDDDDDDYQDQDYDGNGGRGGGKGGRRYEDDDKDDDEIVYDQYGNIMNINTTSNEENYNNQSPKGQNGSNENGQNENQQGGGNGPGESDNNQNNLMIFDEFGNLVPLSPTNNNLNNNNNNLNTSTANHLLNIPQLPKLQGQSPYTMASVIGSLMGSMQLSEMGQQNQYQDPNVNQINNNNLNNFGIDVNQQLQNLIAQSAMIQQLQQQQTQYQQQQQQAQQYQVNNTSMLIIGPDGERGGVQYQIPIANSNVPSKEKSADNQKKNIINSGSESQNDNSDNYNDNLKAQGKQQYQEGNNNIRNSNTTNASDLLVITSQISKEVVDSFQVSSPDSRGSPNSDNDQDTIGDQEDEKNNNVGKAQSNNNIVQHHKGSIITGEIPKSTQNTSKTQTQTQTQQNQTSSSILDNHAQSQIQDLNLYGGDGTQTSGYTPIHQNTKEANNSRDTDSKNTSHDPDSRKGNDKTYKSTAAGVIQHVSEQQQVQQQIGRLPVIVSLQNGRDTYKEVGQSATDSNGIDRNQLLEKAEARKQLQQGSNNTNTTATVVTVTGRVTGSNNINQSNSKSQSEESQTQSKELIIQKDQNGNAIASIVIRDLDQKGAVQKVSSLPLDYLSDSNNGSPTAVANQNQNLLNLMINRSLSQPDQNALQNIVLQQSQALAQYSNSGTDGENQTNLTEIQRLESQLKLQELKMQQQNQMIIQQQLQLAASQAVLQNPTVIIDAARRGSSLPQASTLMANFAGISAGQQSQQNIKPNSGLSHKSHSQDSIINQNTVTTTGTTGAQTQSQNQNQKIHSKTSAPLLGPSASSVLSSGTNVTVTSTNRGSSKDRIRKESNAVGSSQHIMSTTMGHHHIKPMRSKDRSSADEHHHHSPGGPGPSSTRTHGTHGGGGTGTLNVTSTFSPNPAASVSKAGHGGPAGNQFSTTAEALRQNYLKSNLGGGHGGPAFGPSLKGSGIGGAGGARFGEQHLLKHFKEAKVAGGAAANVNGTSGSSVEGDHPHHGPHGGPGGTITLGVGSGLGGKKLRSKNSSEQN